MLFWGGQLMALMQLLIPTLLSSDLGAKKTRSNIRAAVDVTVGCLLAPLLGRAVAREEAQGVTVSSPSPGPRLITVAALPASRAANGCWGGRDLQLLHFTQPKPVGMVHISTYGAQLTHFALLLLYVGLETGARQQGRISVRAAGKAPSQHNPTCCPWDRAVHSPFPRFSRCTERGHPPHHPLPPLGAELAPALGHCSSMELCWGCSIAGRTQRALPALAGTITAHLKQREETSSGCGYNNCHPHGIFKICLLWLPSSSSLPSFLARAPGDE